MSEREITTEGVLAVLKGADISPDMLGFIARRLREIDALEAIAQAVSTGGKGLFTHAIERDGREYNPPHGMGHTPTLDELIDRVYWESDKEKLRAELHALRVKAAAYERQAGGVR